MTKNCLMKIRQIIAAKTLKIRCMLAICCAVLVLKLVTNDVSSGTKGYTTRTPRRLNRKCAKAVFFASMSMGMAASNAVDVVPIFAPSINPTPCDKSINPDVARTNTRPLETLLDCRITVMRMPTIIAIGTL